MGVRKCSLGGRRERKLASSGSNGDSALPHPWKCGDANMFLIVKDKAVVLVKWCLEDVHDSRTTSTYHLV